MLDLFCGAGGMSLGFEMAGYRIGLGLEKEELPFRTHLLNFGGRCHLGDIGEIADPPAFVQEYGLERVDVIIGGPPCQGFSRVGRGKIRSLRQNPSYIHDPRNQYYKEFVRFVEAIKPSYFVWRTCQTWNVTWTATRCYCTGELFVPLLVKRRTKVPVSFNEIAVGQSYSRNELAKLWGYSSMHAIARGVVTPRDDNKIILFVTREKQTSAEQYDDKLSGNELRWEGPNDHFAEDRMLAASQAGDEIHLFYRERHHTDFIYKGQLQVVSSERHTDRPSRFVFKFL